MPVFVLQGFCLANVQLNLAGIPFCLAIFHSTVYSRTLTAWIVLFVDDSEIHLLATNYGWIDCFEQFRLKEYILEYWHHLLILYNNQPVPGVTNKGCT